MAEELETNYESMVKEITEIEASAQKPEFSSADVSSVFSPATNEKVVTYRDMVSIVESIESKKVESRQKVVTPQVLLQQQAQPHMVMTGLKQMTTSQVLPNVQQPMQPQQQPKPEYVEQKQKMQAKSEMKSATSKLQRKSAKVNVKHINVSDMVLPSLSMADQISELERIIEGLRERVFDQEHLEIVVQEVYALKQVVEKQDKEMKKQHANLTALEQSMWQVRAQRLNDALSIIALQGVV